jgi:hypothetical protein
LEKGKWFLEKFYFILFLYKNEIAKQRNYKRHNGRESTPLAGEGKREEIEE